MKIKHVTFVLLYLVVLVGWIVYAPRSEMGDLNPQEVNQGSQVDVMSPTKLRRLEEGLSTIRYDDSGFQDFLDQGGASSDEEYRRFYRTIRTIRLL